MFVHSRFVLVDDRKEHLAGIKKTLNALRLDCHALHYEVETVGEWVKLPGTRILFIDKNLRPGVTMGAGTQDSFAAIAEVIELLICPDSGPYGLILWADEPDLEGLRKFLFERLAKDDPRLLPVFFAELKKTDFLDAEHNPIDPEALKEAIMDRLSSNEQMKALFTWEADVSAAVDAVLRSIVDLVPDGARASVEFGSELGKVLYRLSQAGAGIERATESPREAINRVLVPILADRITEHDPDSGEGFNWNEALNETTESPSVQAQASVNTAIHLSFARSSGSSPISPTELGAVVELPEELQGFLQSRFGLAESDFRDALFKLNTDEWQDCRPRLLQIGAACDAAQPKPGPLLYLFAFEWSFANADGLKAKGGDPKGNLSTNKSRKPKELEWVSPILQFSDVLNPGHISVFKNLALSIPKSEAERWKPVYRFREELVSQLTQDYARYISRPGIVTLPS